MYDFDDPYSFLALHLIAISTHKELERILVDDEYLFKLLMKEVRYQDFRGPFVDAIIDDILRNKQRMELMHELDKLSEYLFVKLDKERLRNKIIHYTKIYCIM